MVLEINCFYCVHSGKPNAKKEGGKKQGGKNTSSIQTEDNAHKSAEEMSYQPGSAYQQCVGFLCGCVSDFFFFLPSGTLERLATCCVFKDASPQKTCDGAEAACRKSEAKTKANKTRVGLQKEGVEEKLQRSTLILELQSIARVRGRPQQTCTAAATVVCLTCCLNSSSQVESVASLFSKQAMWWSSK